MLEVHSAHSQHNAVLAFSNVALLSESMYISNVALSSESMYISKVALLSESIHMLSESIPPQKKTNSMIKVNQSSTDKAIPTVSIKYPDIRTTTASQHQPSPEIPLALCHL